MEYSYPIRFFFKNSPDAFSFPRFPIFMNNPPSAVRTHSKLSPDLFRTATALRLFFSFTRSIDLFFRGWLRSRKLLPLPSPIKYGELPCDFSVALLLFRPRDFDEE